MPRDVGFPGSGVRWRRNTCEDIIHAPEKSYCVSTEDKTESQTYPVDLVLGDRGENQGIFGDVANYLPPRLGLTCVVQHKDGKDKDWSGRG